MAEGGGGGGERSKVEAVSQFRSSKPEPGRQDRTHYGEPGSVLQRPARAATDVQIKVRSDCKGPSGRWRKKDTQKNKTQTGTSRAPCVMVCPGRWDVGPASALVVFLEELGMTWSLQECTEQRGSSERDILWDCVCAYACVCVCLR